MNIGTGIALTEDHLALLDTARRFTASRCTPAVARAALEAEGESLPPFWDELVELGWLGLHVPEDDGGSGYGLAELAVVVEELGRVVAPGPFLPTVLAAAVLSAGGGAGSDELRALVSGTPGAVVLDPSAPVLGGGVAELFVVAGTGVVRRDDVTVTPVPSLDGTRRVATVDLGDAEPVLALTSLDAEEVRRIATTLVAAECAGGAAWCVDTAAEYARVRQQFGRPIGQFQGVKHKCADMLVALEQARAVAWDASGEPGDELAGAIAGAVGPDAYVHVAKDCIQVLGGIGFTWEHDAHLYLRRALALRQLFGGGDTWRAATARLALSGARRRLSLNLPDEAESVRPEIRAAAERIAALPKESQRAALVDERLLVPHWPEPWGRDAGPVEQLVIDEELRRVKVRRPNLVIGAWAAPTIAAAGTIEQQERWVRPTLLGEIAWCQLFSEPGAGSDLAALTTTATRTDGGWLVNGQKVWTSMARDADWGICLVRTNKQAAKHLGITYVIVDMRSPGLDIRPLREITGEAMFNEVFFDDVFVPDDCVIGEVDGGWPLARTTLANERVAMASGATFGGGVEGVLALAAEQPGATEDTLLLDRVGGLVAEAHTVSLLALRTTLRSLGGLAPGAESSVRKLLAMEHDQDAQELGLSLLGPAGATTDGAAGGWTFGFLANRCLTIAGGTSEIQRNVIAERILGLPRDP